jgi:hypothetical protein
MNRPRFGHILTRWLNPAARLLLFSHFVVVDPMANCRLNKMTY